MNGILKCLAVALLLGMTMRGVAQEPKEENKPVYQFTETVNVPRNA